MNSFMASESVKFFDTCLYIVASNFLAGIDRCKIYIFDSGEKIWRISFDA